MNSGHREIPEQRRQVQEFRLREGAERQLRSWQETNHSELFSGNARKQDKIIPFLCEKLSLIWDISPGPRTVQLLFARHWREASTAEAPVM